MPKKIAAVSAVNKVRRERRAYASAGRGETETRSQLMAIQSDLFSRHYIAPEA